MTDKNFGLIRSKFKENGSLEFQLIDSFGRKLKCAIQRPIDSTKSDRFTLAVPDLKNKKLIEVGSFFIPGTSDLRYLLMDFKPGGFKEIIVLHEYYIMNGDNSDIYIYEIKNN